MATVLLSEPDEQTRVVLAALLEALGHRVVDDLASGPVDAAVIEPASREALSLVRRARSNQTLPVVCVSSRRRSVTAMRLEPVAFIDKPAPIGPFVRAVTIALDPERAARRVAARRLVEE
jgi:CheY-like chemotaxis protein